MNNSIPVCYITDTKYFVPTIVSISSLLESRNPSTQYDVYLVTDHKIDQGVKYLEQLRALHPSCNITHILAEDFGVDLIAERKNHVSRIALLKYRLCELLPSLDKALYLDGDTIIQEDLSALYATDLNENYVAAARGLIGYDEKYHIWRYDQRLGVSFTNYVNTGVLLMNLKAFREKDLPSKLLQFNIENSDLVFMDQDAFNVVCKDNIVPIDQRYNLQPSCSKVASMRPLMSKPREAAILHFAGPKKPWMYPRTTWANIYRPYFRRSPAAKEYLIMWAKFPQVAGSWHLDKQLKQLKNKTIRKAVRASTRFRELAKTERIRELNAFSSQFYFLERAHEGKNRGLHEGEDRTRKITISLTSIQPRLYEISTTIESLLMQTVKPDRIILWLDEKKNSPESLPLMLAAQQERGLTIRFCEDIGPHTKLLPTLKEHPDDVIITVDDDILYPPTLIERLYAAYLKDPSRVYCNRARHISILKTRGISYEKDWPNLLSPCAGLNILPLGVGGVLYPPGVLDSEVFNLERQKQLAPKADDIWFKAMTLRNGVTCERIPGPRHEFPMRPFSQEVSLHSQNVKGGGNEEQIQKCFQYYKLWPLLGANDL